jgi:hypothetical protein
MEAALRDVGLGQRLRLSPPTSVGIPLALCCGCASVLCCTPGHPARGRRRSGPGEDQLRQTCHRAEFAPAPARDATTACVWPSGPAQVPSSEPWAAAAGPQRSRVVSRQSARPKPGTVTCLTGTVARCGGDERAHQLGVLGPGLKQTGSKQNGGVAEQVPGMVRGVSGNDWESQIAVLGPPGRRELLWVCSTLR